MSTQIANIIDLAKGYVQGWQFWEIREIKWCADRDRGALWFPEPDTKTARIEVGWHESEEILWHEIFHSVWQDCPLNRIEPAWGEGFCNAFHQFNNFVSHHGPEFPTVEHYDGARTEDGWLRTYGIPEALLMREFKRNRFRFRTGFRSLNFMAQENFLGIFAFSHHMGYDPEAGERLEQIRIPYFQL